MKAPLLKMRELPGFLAALGEVKAKRPDLPAEALRLTAETERRWPPRLRMGPGVVERWAEWHALLLEIAGRDGGTR